MHPVAVSLIIFIVLAALSVPVSISLLLGALIGLVVAGYLPSIASFAIYDFMSSYILLAVYFFVLSGALLSEGDGARRLLDLVSALTKRIRGGLPIAGVVSLAAFGAVSGSAFATFFAIGRIMIPGQISRGVREDVAIGSIATFSFLGILIPPSIPLVLYAMYASQSPTQMLIAGVVPGLFIMCAGVIYLWVRGNALYTKRPEVIQAVSAEEGSQNGEVSRALKGAWAILLMPIVVLGGIFAGMFTATEGAAVGMGYSLLLECGVYRKLKFGQVKEILVSSTTLNAGILLICGAAGVLNHLIILSGFGKQMAQSMVSFTDSPIVFLILVNILYLTLGCLLDAVSAIVLTVPLLSPIIAAYGIDPVHFGIIVCVNLGVGYVTPPVGTILYAAVALTNKTIPWLLKAMAPFIAVTLVCLIIITYVPQISIWLPRLLSR